MTEYDDSLAAIRESWPGVDAFLAMSPEAREVDALDTLNAARATVGGAPLDHFPIEAELLQNRENRKQAYRRQHNTWHARWNRLLDRLLGQLESHKTAATHNEVTAVFKFSYTSRGSRSSYPPSSLESCW